MLFVQLGREVAPRDASLRRHRGVIVGIKNDKLVVVQKQDRTREMVRLRDVVLVDKVHSLDELASSTCEFYAAEEAPAATSDFERFVGALRERVAGEIVRERGL